MLGVVVFPTLFAISAEPRSLVGTSTIYTIEPESLRVTASTPPHESIAIAEALGGWREPDSTEALDGGLLITYSAPALLVKFAVRPMTDELTIEFAAGEDQTIDWPTIPLDVGRDALIWPRGEGNYVPLADAGWREFITGESWDTLESLAMPVWGVEREGATISWFVSTPFRNSLTFSSAGGSGEAALHFAHEFHHLSPERKITFHVFLDRAASPIQPALHYRDYLIACGQFESLQEKAARVPRVERLLGAAHVYLWGGAPISRHDIPRNRWKPFAERLRRESDADPDSVAAKLRARFTAEQWAAVEECVAVEWPYEFLKQRIAAGLSEALEEGALVPEAAGLDRARCVALNGAALAAAFPDDVLPPRDWGDGVSLKMLRALDAAGLDRLKLCLEGWSGAEIRPWVAEEADRRGWLFGTYDSYHSIHNPASRGTDATWETAQMTPELWRVGGIMNATGEYLTGFKKIGRKLNPIAGRAYFEQRVGANVAAVPYNYYFIDCDATGEVYDDYNPVHSNSLEAGAAARMARLRWLAEARGLVVGTEGGRSYAVDAVHVAEGVFDPYFGWGDAAMTDEESPYYRGRYFPPDAPDVNFKPIPLQPRYLEFQYDPRYRIPLFETVYHDAEVSTHHWSNAHFKYPEVRTTTALMELLYLCPPMYHLNLDEFAKRRDRILEHYDAWSPVHRRFGFAPLTRFEWLTPDRLVQSTSFGEECTVVANFGEAPFPFGGVSIPSRGALVSFADGSAPVVYRPTPSAE